MNLDLLELQLDEFSAVCYAYMAPVTLEIQPCKRGFRASST